MRQNENKTPRRTPRVEPPARENEKKEEKKPTTNNIKLQSPEDLENKTPQPKTGRQLRSPWYTPWGTQNSTGEGRLRSHPFRRTTNYLAVFQKRRTQETGAT